MNASFYAMFKMRQSSSRVVFACILAIGCAVLCGLVGSGGCSERAERSADLPPDPVMAQVSLHPDCAWMRTACETVRWATDTTRAVLLARHFPSHLSVQARIEWFSRDFSSYRVIFIGAKKLAYFEYDRNLKKVAYEKVVEPPPIYMKQLTHMLGALSTYEGGERVNEKMWLFVTLYANSIPSRGFITDYDPAGGYTKSASYQCVGGCFRKALVLLQTPHTHHLHDDP